MGALELRPIFIPKGQVSRDDPFVDKLSVSKENVVNTHQLLEAMDSTGG